MDQLSSAIKLGSSIHATYYKDNLFSVTYDATGVAGDNTGAEVTMVVEAAAALACQRATLDPAPLAAERLDTSAAHPEPIGVARGAPTLWQYGNKATPAGSGGRRRRDEKL